MGKNSQTRNVMESGSAKSARGKGEIAGYRKRVYDIVRRIPAGRVMTYGQIANMLGDGYTPRTVGYVMHASEEENVPWQRVINSQGACSTGRITLPKDIQRRMLEGEGIKFDSHGRCDLDKYRCLIDVEDLQRANKEDEKAPSLFKARPSRSAKSGANKGRARDPKRKR